MGKAKVKKSASMSPVMDIDDSSSSTKDSNEEQIYGKFDEYVIFSV